MIVGMELKLIPPLVLSVAAEHHPPNAFERIHRRQKFVELLCWVLQPQAALGLNHNVQGNACEKECNGQKVSPKDIKSVP